MIAVLVGDQNPGDVADGVEVDLSGLERVETGVEESGSRVGGDHQAGVGEASYGCHDSDPSATSTASNEGSHRVILDDSREGQYPVVHGDVHSGLEQPNGQQRFG